MADNYEESEEVREVGELRYDEAEQESEGRDYYPVQSRQKRYALQGSRWKTRVLTYKVGKYPDKLSKREVDNDVLKAFSLWSQASGLKFIRRSSGSVNIEIRFSGGCNVYYFLITVPSRFEDYYHGDEDSFDGPGGRAINSMQFQIIPFLLWSHGIMGVCRCGGSRFLSRVRR